MHFNQKFLSVVLIAGATFVGFLYTSSNDDSMFLGESGSCKVIKPIPQVQVTGKTTRVIASASYNQEVADVSNANIGTDNNLSSNGISQDRPSAIASAPLIKRSSNGDASASQAKASGQVGGAVFYRASSRSGSSSAHYASSSLSSSSSLAMNSIDGEMNSTGTTRSFAKAATSGIDGGFDPGGDVDPGTPPIPIPDGTAFLLLLAVGYTVWKFRKTNAA